MKKQLLSYVAVLLLIVVGAGAMVAVGLLGQHRRCTSLLEARDSAGLTRFCGYEIYEDGSGARQDRHGNEVERFEAGFFPWDCKTMGNRTCGNPDGSTDTYYPDGSQVHSPSIDLLWQECKDAYPEPGFEQDTCIESVLDKD